MIKVIITDGVNPAHFVAVDKDGNIRAGVMGIPAPTNKPRIEQMTEWDGELWQDEKPPVDYRLRVCFNVLIQLLQNMVKNLIRLR